MYSEYEELEKKTTNLKNVLGKYIKNNNLFSMIPSPKNIRYRNNIMFSMGKNSQGEIEVGPFESIKSKVILPPQENKLVSELGIKICNYLKIWIKEYSNLPVTEYPSFDGFWRHIHIRQNRDNDFIICLRFSNYYKYEIIWKEERYKFLKYLQSIKEIRNNKFKLLNISYQICNNKSEPKSEEPYYLIYNEGDLIETILGNKFIVNAGCFFQVNMYSSKFIYNIVKSLITPKKDNILFDLCCGIGMYSIILSDFFKKVIGIDNNIQNIILAELNSEMNKKSNIKFIRNRVEECFTNLVTMNFTNKSLIVNPPRRGLYEEVLKSINENIDSIDEIIYISCNVETLKRDLDLLNLKSKRITHIIPLNQFPSTEHYEIILKIE